ncbi:MAG: lipoyl synthase [Planctomycetota bacterium]|jgi:lipoic acid synthetase
MLAVIEKTKKRSLRTCDCGVADYRQVLQQQYELHEKRCAGRIPDSVLITEHRPVITLGARESANKLVVGRKTLAERGIDVVEIRRGGGTTAHNPGQLVIYPILHLRELGIGISEYIRELEATGVELLLELGVRAERRKGFPGLWIGERKIASIGVRVSKSVTYHGMAINIQNDLSIFDYIVPCGLDDVEMTSVFKETGRHYPMNQIKEQSKQLLIKHFSNSNEIRKLPQWLKRRLPTGKTYKDTSEILNSLGLETICHNANCPNRGQCWERGTATVLILGNICTRNCGFCSVKTGQPAPPNPTEPQRLASMVKQMGLKYLVITSVNRDDLRDGGAKHFRDCINEVRQRFPDVKFEILTPDFRDCQVEAIEALKSALPFIFTHNVETVPSLYQKVRAGGNYQWSLNLLRMAKESYNGIQTKSSIMLGLGETDAEVEEVLRDLRKAGCSRITIGQYLKPSKDSLEVVEYIPPEKFDFWKQKAIELGFSWVISAPFARSSYFAEQESTIQRKISDC